MHGQSTSFPGRFEIPLQDNHLGSQLLIQRGIDSPGNDVDFRLPPAGGSYLSIYTDTATTTLKDLDGSQCSSTGTGGISLPGEVPQFSKCCLRVILYVLLITVSGLTASVLKLPLTGSLPWDCTMISSPHSIHDLYHCPDSRTTQAASCSRYRTLPLDYATCSNVP